MTYEEIVERVRKKSTICSKCGCFVSSLLDCCPACGHVGGEVATVKKLAPPKPTKLDPELKMRFDLYDSYINKGIDTAHFLDVYKALGGNAQVDVLYADDKPFHTEYTDYAACYQKRKADELKAQLQTEKLYYAAIKVLKSYSGNKEEEKEYVYHYPF